MDEKDFNIEENNQENEVLNEDTEEIKEEIIAEESSEENAEQAEISEGSANYSKKKKKKKEAVEKTSAQEFLEWVQAIVIAVVVAFVVKAFLFDIVLVDGPSMEPTLHTSDRMILWKLGYEPDYGDIVVLENATTGKPYIKRVIALEGDTVRIDYDTNSVYVSNGGIEIKLIEPYINVCSETDCLMRCNGDSMKPKGNIYEITVPKGEVFVMGDNRNHSVDSREIGTVKKKDVWGKAVLRFWPLNSIKTY